MIIDQATTTSEKTWSLTNKLMKETMTSITIPILEIVCIILFSFILATISRIPKISRM